MSGVGSIAQHAKALLPASELAIPWDTLRARGECCGFRAAYILEYLLPAWGRATEVFKTLDATYTRDVDHCARSFITVRNSLNDLWNNGLPEWMNAVAAPTWLALDLPPNTYAGYIGACYWSLTNGIFAHSCLISSDNRELSIHYSGFSDEEIMQNADQLFATANLLVRLNSLGALSPIKGGAQPAAGLGAAPFVISGTVIAVIAIAAIVCIAATVVLVTESVETTRVRQRVVEEKLAIQRETCANTTDRAVQLECAKGPTVDDVSGGTVAAGMTGALSNALSGGITQVLKYLAIGIGAYAFITLLPSLIDSAQDAKKAAET